ncbi:MAG: glycosyltransferase family 39 protein, partial [Candidatus Brocadiaceae bacterium]|nr:glycosyltransferase family 39 protein [Candidatus Brocadiaceae bacterium]
MIIFLFSLLASIIFLALAKSFFHWEVISLASVLSLILLKKNNITFDFFKEIFCSSRKRVFFYSCLVFSIFVTFAYFEGFDEGQDARGTHLPVARFIALNHAPPTGMDLSENAPLIPLITPGIHGLAAVLFQITGLQRAWIASLIPLSFSFLFLAVVFRWSYNYGQTLIIPAVAILISPFFVNRMEWFYQEAPLTFATTLLFYCFYRFEIESKEEYLYSAMALSAIIMMIKATGILICTFTLYFIFSRRLYSKSNLIVLFLFHVPPLLWYGYNLYLWGNPFPPHMNSITIYEWSNKAIAAMLEVAFQHNFNEWYNILFGAITIPFVYLWLFLEIRLCIKKK